MRRLSITRLCVCVCARRTHGSSLDVPPLLGLNQSACQPSNTSHLYATHQQPLAMGMCVCARVSLVILSTLSSSPPSPRCAFGPSVLLSDPRCLLCARLPASDPFFSALRPSSMRLKCCQSTSPPFFVLRPPLLPPPLCLLTFTSFPRFSDSYL